MHLTEPQKVGTVHSTRVFSLNVLPLSPPPPQGAAMRCLLQERKRSTGPDICAPGL